VTRNALRENLLVALDTLNSRKLRSGLTILGIVIGVTSVITVASIIDGLNGYIQARVQSFGSKTFFVTRLPAGRFGRPPEKIRLRKYLQLGDAPFIKETCPSVALATTLMNRINFGEQTDTMWYGSAHVERLFVRGVEPDYGRVIPLFSVAQGRFVSAYDLEHARSVVVIGAAIADSLFPHVDPVGKTVRLNGRPYEVIGVFDRDPGLFGGFGVDIFACIPLTNFHKNFPNIHEVAVAVMAQDEASLGQARNEVIETMRRRRRVPYRGENDFEVVDPDFLSNLWNQLTGALALLTGIISSIGLLVGGIGVMNIMLISVTERTAEIGIRKAIGARAADIRVQFLLEAVTLSSIGGFIGIVLGALIAFTVRTLVPSIPASLSLIWVSLGILISLSVGLFFGYYPASRAAKLDPIVCLRYE